MATEVAATSLFRGPDLADNVVRSQTIRIPELDAQILARLHELWGDQKPN